MPRRPGHHRPPGTVTRMRFPDWPHDVRAPELGDVCMETDGPDGPDLDRHYEVVGVIETRTGYRLVCERIASPVEVTWRFHTVRA